MDNIVVALAGAAVEFIRNGNRKQMEICVVLPSLEAKVHFQNEWIEGQHTGSRIILEECRSFKSYGLKVFKIQASGEGKFFSTQLNYTGHFLSGKFHDTTGSAVCVFGTTQRYTGCFEDGHLSGPGKMEMFIDGLSTRAPGKQAYHGRARILTVQGMP